MITKYKSTRCPHCGELHFAKPTKDNPLDPVICPKCSQDILDWPEDPDMRKRDED